MRYRDIDGRMAISACGALCIAVDKSSRIACGDSAVGRRIGLCAIAAPARAVCARRRIGAHFYIETAAYCGTIAGRKRAVVAALRGTPLGSAERCAICLIAL